MPRKLGAEKIERKRIDFFEIGDTTYTRLDPIPKNIALKALAVFRKEGDYAIADWLLETVLGADAYQAVQDCEDITEDDLDWLFNELSAAVLGSLEKALGKSGNGR